jgi:cell division protein FtsL
MLTFIIIAVIIAVAVFVAMKTGKVADANNNNIPDAIEEKIAEVKEVVAEAKEKIAKAPKSPKAKTTAKKTTKK